MGALLVTLSNEPMTISDVADIVAGATVELGPQAEQRILQARQVLDEAITRGDAIYGVTTGVGHARDDRIDPAGLREMQPILLEMHLGGLGPQLPTARVRAALAVRLNGITRGGAGASLGLALGLVALLNHGIHPVLPASGSVGAGDLGQLAAVGRVLLGRGDVEVEGRTLAASDALAAAGLDPIQMEPKDALAVMSSNAVSVGHAALLARRCEQLLAMADLVVATSMEALHANRSIVDPVVARARGSDGQVAVSAAILSALEGSTRTDPAGVSVQDPLSFRVVPQVHGACRDVLEVAAAAVTAELNAASDNPLVDIDSGRVISNGNFHPMNVVLAVESLRVALAHVGLLAERRMGHLWDAVIASFGDPGAGGAGPPLGRGAPPVLAGLALRYPAAARYTQLRQLASPVSLDVPVLDLSVEDHAPNTAETVSVTDQALDVVEDLLIIELLIASLRLDGMAELGAGTSRLVMALHAELATIEPGTSPDEVHRRVRIALRHVAV